jgi:hypothetical protein
VTNPDVLSEFLRRRELTELQASWHNAFFPAQREYVTSETKNIVSLCSRRAGKSIGNAGRLLRTAVAHPGEMSLYISLTKNNSRLIVGRALMDLSRKYDLKLRMKEIDQRLMCIHPNGHMVWLSGAKNRVDFEQFRGYKFAEIIVDEAQLYGLWLKEVVEDVLEPCVGDLDGAIALSGTPGPIPVGFFHAITTGEDVDHEGSRIPKWETHHWTVAENVHFRPNDGGGAAWRDLIRRRRGWQPDHPTLLREYYGLWVKDDNALVYPFDAAEGADGAPGRNVYESLPPGDYIYVIGVDIGYTDNTAFVVLAMRRDHPEVYVIEATTHENMIPARIATHLLSLRREYGPAKIVIDAAARGYIEEFRQRYHLACESSEKQNKLGYIDMLRGDIMSGVVKFNVRDTAPLLDEMMALQWKEDRTGPDERFPDHCCDALLYSFRALRPYYRPEIEGPPPGSPEAEQLAMEAYKASLEEKIEIRQQAKWKQLRKRFDKLIKQSEHNKRLKRR